MDMMWHEKKPDRILFQGKASALTVLEVGQWVVAVVFWWGGWRKSEH